MMMSLFLRAVRMIAACKLVLAQDGVTTGTLNGYRNFGHRNVERAVVEICAILNSFSYSTELQVALPSAEMVLGSSRELTMTEMIADGTRDFSRSYTAWLRKPVVLLVVIRQCHIPVPCSILGESAASLRVRFEPGWEMDLRKDLILAVEEDAAALDPRMN